MSWVTNRQIKAGAEGLYGIRTTNDREAGEWKNYYRNNTYKGIRLMSDEYSLYYSVWCTNDTEFFDLKVSHSPRSFLPYYRSFLASIFPAF